MAKKKQTTQDTFDFTAWLMNRLNMNHEDALEMATEQMATTPPGEAARGGRNPKEDPMNGPKTTPYEIQGQPIISREAYINALLNQGGAILTPEARARRRQILGDKYDAMVERLKALEEGRAPRNVKDRR